MSGVTFQKGEWCTVYSSDYQLRDRCTLVRPDRLSGALWKISPNWSENCVFTAYNLSTLFEKSLDIPGLCHSDKQIN